MGSTALVVTLVLCSSACLLLQGVDGRGVRSSKTYGGSEYDDRSMHRVPRPAPEEQPIVSEEEKHANHWSKMAQTQLMGSLKLSRSLNNGVAKNVILFLGDGMGISTLTAARILKGRNPEAGKAGEEGSLEFEKFPHVALSKTYNVNFQVPDSAGTGTAYVTGVKSNMGTLGVTAAVEYGDCSASLNESNHLTSFLEWAIRDKGRSAGVVTTTRITHATPASTYAKTPHRDWECDGYEADPNDPESIPLDPDCDDIATQLVKREPGSLFNVIFGGGRFAFDSSSEVTSIDPISYCPRKENSTSLIEEWKEMMRNKSSAYYYVGNKADLEALPNDVEHVLGLFANDHLPYAYKRNSTDEYREYYPSLVELTRKAISILQKNKNGFALLVEGGRIDHAHHDTQPNIAFQEVLEFDDAVKAALDMTKPEETLIVVTADHSHTLSFAGYPVRGSPMDGFGSIDAADGLPYLKMAYANGKRAYDFDTGSRPDPSAEDVTQPEYRPHVPVWLASETHGGEDVAIYATGPMAHLFHGLHEQNYIAHVMGHASCTGPNKEHCSGASSLAKIESLLASLAVCGVFHFVVKRFFY